MPKAYVLLACPILYLYFAQIADPRFSHGWLSSYMRHIAAPYKIGYIVSFILLLGVGVLCHFQGRRLKAVVDYVFSAIALVGLGALVYWTPNCK